MEESIITWNGENWLTIVLMVAVGAALAFFAAQLYHRTGLPGSASA